MVFILFCLLKTVNKITSIGAKKEEEPAPTTKVCSFCRSEIDIEATRCPHFFLCVCALIFFFHIHQMKRKQQIKDFISVCKIRIQKCFDLIQTVKKSSSVDK